MIRHGRLSLVGESTSSDKTHLTEATTGQEDQAAGLGDSLTGHNQKRPERSLRERRSHLLYNTFSP